MAKTLVFVCTGNTTRSPMAEGYAKKLCADKGTGWEVASAGMAAFPGVPVAAEAVETLKKDGIDIGGQVSKPLGKALVEGAALIVTLSGQHRDMIVKKMPPLEGKVFALKELAGDSEHDIKDPLDESQEFFDKVGREIRETLERAWPALEEKMS